MKLKKGQYYYTYSTMYKCYRIKKADQDCDSTRFCSGSTAYNEPNHTTKESAMKRVCELNGWKYKHKNKSPELKAIGDAFKEFCKSVGI